MSAAADAADGALSVVADATAAADVEAAAGHLLAFWDSYLLLDKRCQQCKFGHLELDGAASDLAMEKAGENSAGSSQYSLTMDIAVC